jgi:hypothetical protein
MKTKYKVNLILEAVLLFIALAGLFAGNSSAAEESRYLKAVQEFADNVLKHGSDTYGPKHTPLFVDGLNIHNHVPTKWIAPNEVRWILSNLASQQNFFRTLDGLMQGSVNVNQRAESILSFLLGILAIIESYTIVDKIELNKANALPQINLIEQITNEQTSINISSDGKSKKLMLNGSSNTIDYVVS